MDPSRPATRGEGTRVRIAGLLARLQPKTITYGDAHAWNCFLPTGPGAPRLFDRDACRIDHASDDLAYLMAVHWYPDRHGALEHWLHLAVDDLDRRALLDWRRTSSSSIAALP